RKEDGMFSREHFLFNAEQRSVRCPAGRAMKGPESQGGGLLRWYGDGCGQCALKTRCTKGKQRSFNVDPELDDKRQRLRTAMSEPANRARYNRRIATVEPVFSSLEDAMGYRRASSRRGATVIAEVLLKVLAHNIRRLCSAAKLRRVWLLLTET